MVAIKGGGGYLLATLGPGVPLAEIILKLNLKLEKVMGVRRPINRETNQRKLGLLGACLWAAVQTKQLHDSMAPAHKERRVCSLRTHVGGPGLGWVQRPTTSLVYVRGTNDHEHNNLFH